MSESEHRRTSTANVRESVIALAALENAVMVALQRGADLDETASKCGMTSCALREAFARWSETADRPSAPIRFIELQIPAALRGPVCTTAAAHGLSVVEMVQSVLHATLQTPHEPTPARRIRGHTRSRHPDEPPPIPTGKWSRMHVGIPVTNGLWEALCLRAKAIKTLPSKYLVGLLRDLTHGRLMSFTFERTVISDQFLFASQYLLPASSGSVAAQETSDG